jgi:hypothetical protein
MINDDDQAYYTHMGDTQCLFCEALLHPRCVYHKCGIYNEDGNLTFPRVDNLLCDDETSIIISVGDKEKRTYYQQIKELPWKE